MKCRIDKNFNVAYNMQSSKLNKIIVSIVLAISAGFLIITILKQNRYKLSWAIYNVPKFGSRLEKQNTYIRH